MVILIFILWLLYSCFEGRREGYYWETLFNSGGRPTNEHKTWSIQRTIVCMVFLLASMTGINSFISEILLIIAYPLAFPFIHDGAYYRTRNIVSKGKHYPLRFWDFSTTSTAFFTKFNRPVLRSLYFTISIGLLIFSVL